MSLYALYLILIKQLQQKWGRFLLASGGIMVGIWAITLTTSLSLGLSSTITEAINSQDGAKSFLLSKTKDGATDFFDIKEAPKFVAISQSEVDTFKTKNPAIRGAYPNNSAITVNQKLDSNPCTPIVKNISEITLELATNNCNRLTLARSNFDKFYEQNRLDWVGSKSPVKSGEIVVCFKCSNFGQSLKATTPEELLNKQISLEYVSAPIVYNAGSIIDTQNSARGSVPISESKVNNFIITAVIDDRDSSNAQNNFYVDKSYFEEAISLSKQNVDSANIGYINWEAYVDTYQNTASVINNLKADKYLAFSATLLLVQAVQTGFLGLTVVLGLFGLIALIASVFGIVNVMTISVLERQKEIGILKSLGARDGDIFKIFLIESGILGFFGWVLGTLLSVSMGLGISYLFKVLINSNKEWKSNLETFNIEGLTPFFPWQLLLATLVLALFFTILSGVFPALKASRQNPVEVLRSE